MRQLLPREEAGQTQPPCICDAASSLPDRKRQDAEQKSGLRRVEEQLGLGCTLSYHAHGPMGGRPHSRQVTAFPCAMYYTDSRGALWTLHFKTLANVIHLGGQRQVVSTNDGARYAIMAFR